MDKIIENINHAEENVFKKNITVTKIYNITCPKELQEYGTYMQYKFPKQIISSIEGLYVNDVDIIHKNKNKLMYKFMFERALHERNTYQTSITLIKKFRKTNNDMPTKQTYNIIFIIT